MKKTTLFLVALVFVFGLFITNIDSARAYDTEGTLSCQVGWTFNPFTGVPCTPNTKPTGCLPGYLYNPITGQSCTGTKPIEVSSVIITGVSGPQSLKVNQTGTWKISAYDLDGGDLTYGVVWGDERPIAYPLADGASVARAMQQSATFTHKYSQAGTYTPRFTVTSENTIRCITTPCPSNGGTAQTSLSVNVGDVVSSIKPMVFKDIKSIKNVAPYSTANLYFGVQTISSQYNLGGYHKGQWYEGLNPGISGPVWVEFGWPT